MGPFHCKYLNLLRRARAACAAESHRGRGQQRAGGADGRRVQGEGRGRAQGHLRGSLGASGRGAPRSINGVYKIEKHKRYPQHLLETNKIAQVGSKREANVKPDVG